MALNRYLALLMCGINIMTVGTGLYSLVPSAAYIIILLASAILFINQAFMREPLRFVEKKMVAGFLIFNAFFILHTLFFPAEARIYFVNLVSLGVFLLSYAYGKLTIFNQDSTKLRQNEIYISLFSLGALAILLLGQMAEMFGYIDRRGLGLDGQEATLLFRPGGFLNPNMTAAIALVFLFIAESLNRERGEYLVLSALSLTTIIVMLSQSRAAIVVLLLYLTFLVLRKGLLSFVVISTSLVTLISIGALVYQDDVIELIEATMLRFGGDESSNERVFVLNYGLSEFSKAPLLGNGYRHLTSVLGFSAHNEMVENLVNFGVVGVMIIALAFYFIYWPASVLFFLICVVPTFIFSHNFFETTAFQAALGLALAIDRLKNVAHVKMRLAFRFV